GVRTELGREATKHDDDVEAKRLDRVSWRSRAMLGMIRARLMRSQRLLAPEPAALFRLLNRPPAWLRDADVADLRRSAEELSAAVTDSGAVIERVRILQDELSAKVVEEANRTLYILTIITTLLTPSALTT